MAFIQLADTPAVFLRDARQIGKTTPVKKLGSTSRRTYVSLDSATTLAAALAEPNAGWLGLNLISPL